MPEQLQGERGTPATHSRARPDKRLYFLLIALAARTRADCLGTRVGAVIDREDRVISTGYNGTPFGMRNCTDGGCHRCAHRDQGKVQSGTALDVCICVHAEVNAVLTAARFGQQTSGGALTSTVQPCFGCLKELLQAGITEVRYLHPWDPTRASNDLPLAEQYAELQRQFRIFEQIGVPDADSHDMFADFVRSSQP